MRWSSPVACVLPPGKLAPALPEPVPPDAGRPPRRAEGEGDGLALQGFAVPVEHLDLEWVAVAGVDGCPRAAACRPS